MRGKIPVIGAVIRALSVIELFSGPLCGVNGANFYLMVTLGMALRLQTTWVLVFVHCFDDDG